MTGIRFTWYPALRAQQLHIFLAHTRMLARTRVEVPSAAMPSSRRNMRWWPVGSGLACGLGTAGVQVGVMDCASGISRSPPAQGE